jgi:5-methylcytosine-specific restriction endonuclease McrA
MNQIVGRQFSNGQYKQRLLNELLKRQGGSCGICKRYLDLYDANLDHIVPKAIGGSNRSFNLRATHIACNNKRGSEPEDTPEYRNTLLVHQQHGIYIYRRAPKRQRLISQTD